MNKMGKTMRRVAALAFALALTLAAAAQGRRQLVVLHTNDTHSTVMPLSSLLEDTLKAGRGGFLRRLALVEQQRKADPELLLFDSGDFSQGSAYYTYFKGEVEVELMNRMGYDAVTLGNHEFDFGLDNLAALVRRAKFPVVCANYGFSATPLAGLVKPYVVIRRKGLRIGVFGLGPQPDGLIQKPNYAGMTYSDPVDAAKKTVALLRGKERCDVVVCLSHLGWSMDGDMDDQKLIAATTGIDLVLGGHSHTYMKDLGWVKNADGQPVPDDQNGKHGIFVGRIVLTCEPAAKK